MTSPRLARRILMAVGVVAVTAGVTACGPAQSPTDERTSISIAVGEVYGTYDAIQGAISFTVYPQYSAVFESLLVIDNETSEYAPWLAKEFTVADDRMSVDLVLRDDVDFVDGVHLDADGVKTYLDALFASDAYAINGSIRPYGPEVTTTSEYGLRITTTKPIYDDFMVAVFYWTPIESPAVLDDPEAANATPVGTGPYIVDDVVADSEVTMIRNPDYWNPDAFPYDEVVIKAMPDPIAQLNALKSGQVDVAALPLENVAEAESAGLTLNKGGSVFVALTVQNPAGSPIEALRDPRVRQAMMYAFDREAILETIYHGYGTTTSQSFSSVQPEYVEGGDERYGYDPDKARDLLAEAGYPDGFDLPMPTWTGTANIEPIVQQSLGDIGIRVTYESFPDFLTYFKASFDGSFAVSMGEGANNNIVRLLTEEFPGFGRSPVPTPEVEALVKQIKEGDAEESAAASQELGELLLDEAWLIPLVRPAVIWASAPDVVVEMGEKWADVDLRNIRRAE